jgi:GTP-binding protein
VINRELALADPALAAKPQIVVANKLDLAEARDRFPEIAARLAEKGVTVLGVSAATGEGLRELTATTARLLAATREAVSSPEDGMHRASPESRAEDRLPSGDAPAADERAPK